MPVNTAEMGDFKSPMPDDKLLSLN